MKRILALLLCVAMITTFMPTMAFAEGGETANGSENIAKIGDVEYSTLQAAVTK